MDDEPMILKHPAAIPPPPPRRYNPKDYVEPEPIGCALLMPIGDDGPCLCHGEGIRPCAICGVVASSLCDYPMGDGKTCDAELCEFCAIPQVERLPIAKPEVYEPERGEDDDRRIDFCPVHDLIAKREKAEKDH